MKIEQKYLPLIISTAAASFMVNLDTYIINVSIPAIACDFSINKADVSWVVMSYNLMVVSLLLICGKLADRIGLKKLFVCGFLIFTISSIFCSFSNNIIQLTASRILQGIGASILYALPQAIIGKFLPVNMRGYGFALSASAAALGIMLGSPISGFITGISSWHNIFLINVPVGILIVVLILKDRTIFVENKLQTKSNPEQFDIKGSILSFFAILGLTVWLNRLNSYGFENVLMNLVPILCVILLTLFIKHCDTSKNPLVDLRVFKNKYFSYANIAMFFVSAFLAGNNFIIPFYLTEIKNFSELQIGIYFIIYSASYMLFSLCYGKISTKISPAKVSTVAGVSAILSILFFILNINQDSNLYVIIYFITLGMSFSFFITSNNNFVMQQATAKNAGAIAGFHRMTGRFGMLFGVVVFEFLFTFANKINLSGYLLTYEIAIVVCLIATIFSAMCTKFKNIEGG